MGVLNRDLMGYNYNGEYLFKMINSSGMNIKLSSGVIKPGWKIKALNAGFHLKHRTQWGLFQKFDYRRLPDISWGCNRDMMRI